MSTRIRRSIVAGLFVIAIASIWLGIRNTPESLSSGGVLCGQACVFRISHLRGAPVSMEQIIKEMPATSGTHSLQDIAAFLNKQQIPTEGLRLSIDELNDASFPCVAALNDPAHFVVLIHKDTSTIHLFEADGHRSVVTIADLRKRWANVVLVAKERRAPTGTERKETPSIRVDALYKDIGWISNVSQPRDVEFKVQNAGAMPLVISDVMLSCKCLESSLDAAELKPGETTTLHLKYKPDTKTGWFEQSVVLTSNDPEHPVVELTTAGIAAQGLIVQPERLQFNADSKTGKILPQYVFLTHPDHYRSFRILKSHVTDQRLLVREVEWDQTEKEEWYSRLGAVGEVPYEMASDRKFRVLKVSVNQGQNLVSGDTSVIEMETDVERFEHLRIPVTIADVNPVRPFPPIIQFNGSESDVATREVFKGTVHFSGPVLNCRIAGLTDGRDIPDSFAVRTQMKEKSNLLRVDFEVSRDDAEALNGASVSLEFGSGSHVVSVVLPILLSRDSNAGSDVNVPVADR